MSSRFSILIVVALLCSGATLQPSLAGGKADWPGYAWQKIDIRKCAALDEVLACPLYHQKWDWKRNQWVDITLALDLATGRATLAQRLTNRDPSDRDYVCITALVVDASDQNLVAHHQNWQVSPGEVVQKDFVYASSALPSAAAVYIGGKQCREGAGQDDALYRHVMTSMDR